MPVLITVAETPEYIRCATRLFSAADRMEVVEYLAANPKAGDLMQGTGGVRKLRWGRGGRGKNERANLSKAERNELAGLVRMLKAIVEMGR